MKKKMSLIAALLCGLTTRAFPQTAHSDKTKAFTVFQGEGVYDDAMMRILNGLKEFIWNDGDIFVEMSKILCAVFMIIFFAIKSYEMMTGDKRLEILPLLRPFGLAMIILWWKPFVTMVAYPTNVVASIAEDRWKTAQVTADNLRLKRAELMTEMADSFYAIQAKTQVAEKEADTWYGQAWDAVNSTVKKGISTVIAPILELKQRMQVSMQLLMTQLLELIGLWILRISVYFVFLIQVIYSSLLILLGPFAVAVSILPSFRDSMTTWIARFISVNLYSGIAYLIMWLCSYVQQYAMLVENSRYENLLHSGSADKLGQLAIFASNGIFSFGTVIITFIIGGIAMFTVPSISTWIISTSGISSAASTFGRATGTVAGAAKAAAGSFF